MLVLLPPSEGKAMPTAGDPVDLQALVYPALTPQRERLLKKLKGVAEAPAAPAAEVYTGVLYQQLGLPDLPGDRVLIASGLWGVVRPADPIPHYKLPIDARLPRMKTGLAAFWRAPLAKVMPDEPGLVLDLRSGGYVAAWKPKRATRLGVRGFTEAPDGSRKVISHMAKRVRGDVARAVLLGDQPETPADVLAIVTAAGMRAELADGYLDVIEPSP
ncbi:MAG: uncharacterized protein QOE86_2770 [Solirubrobacteraceae bacterium]|nr:uncharacterized protein [Solirubrobacteraceae bacterium]